MSFDNVAELLECLGNVPPARVRLRPPPGQATEKDLLTAIARGECLFELIDGTLVEKAVGFAEGFVAAEIACEVGDFAEEHDLGLVAGGRGTMRLRPGLVRTSCVSFFTWDKFPDRLLPRKPIPDLVPDLAVEVLRRDNTP